MCEDMHAYRWRGPGVSVDWDKFSLKQGILLRSIIRELDMPVSDQAEG